MNYLSEIKEDVLNIPQNQELVKMLYPEVWPEVDDLQFAYLAYVDSDKKLPIQGLFSDDIAWLQQWLGLKKELEAFLAGTGNPAFADLLFFLDAYKRHKTFRLSLSKICEPPSFNYNPVLDNVLKDSRGYILWHYQLEGLIRIFISIPDRARDIRKGLNRRDPGTWELIKTFRFADGSTLFNVYNERSIASTTSNPQYREAYNLFNLITKQERINEA